MDTAASNRWTICSTKHRLNCFPYHVHWSVSRIFLTVGNPAISGQQPVSPATRAIKRPGINVSSYCEACNNPRKDTLHLMASAYRKKYPISCVETQYTGYHQDDFPYRHSAWSCCTNVFLCWSTTPFFQLEPILYFCLSPSHFFIVLLKLLSFIILQKQ